MGQESPYYPWYPKDFASDPNVIAMDNTQELIYRRLLDRAWELYGLPEDEEQLARLAGVRRNTFRRAWSYPLTECWETNDLGRLVNPRQEKIRIEITKRSESARDAAEKRWEKQRKQLSRLDPPHADALPEQCYPKPKPKPNTKISDLNAGGDTQRHSSYDRFDSDFRLTPGEAGSGSAPSLPQPKPPNDPTAVAKRYLAVCSAVQERRLRTLSPDVVKKTRERLKDWKPWQIVAVPILVWAHGRRQKYSPEVFLRDGSNPRTRNGNTSGAHYWLAREFENADGTRLDARLTSIARQAGVLEQLESVGVLPADEEPPA